MRLTRWLAPALLSLTGCSALGLPEGATSQGQEIAGLWRVFFWAGVAVAGVVLGLILWSVLRYRRRDGREPARFREHVPVEIAYTAIPLLIVAGLFVVTVRTENSVGALSPTPDVTVDVDAFNWSWRFTYPAEGIVVEGTPDVPPELVLPVDRTVRINLRAEDLIHSFFIPEFLFKRDAIPGRTTSFDLDIDKPGVYAGQCAEFCGLDHARMRFSVRAVPPAEFAAWLREASEEGTS